VSKGMHCCPIEVFPVAFSCQSVSQKAPCFSRTQTTVLTQASPKILIGYLQSIVAGQ